jgi:Tfp pilus assembly protein PilF
MAATARVSARRFLAAAALAAAASLQAVPAAGHESHRHRSALPERAAISAADEAQSRHEFTEARAELDRLLAADPRDLEARLMSANLFLLSGQFERARGECRLVLATGALQAGTICLAASLTGPGSVDRGRRMIAALGDPTGSDVELSRWRLLTEADLALRAGDGEAALSFHERAFALDPGHEEARTRLVELVLELGNVTRALGLARAPDPSVARLVLRVRAARMLGTADAISSLDELKAMIEADRSKGIPPHLREEAQIALYVYRDAPAAVRLARLNFETQKDTPDLRMLAAAATAAADASAMAALHAWMRETGFEDATVDAPSTSRVGATESRPP